MTAVIAEPAPILSEADLNEIEWLAALGCEGKARLTTGTMVAVLIRDE
jgi:hypothetical protein